MDFNLNDEQQMLRDSARRFVRENYAFEQRRAIVGSALGFSAEHWRSYADFGWLALGLPEDVGGLACSFVETAVLMEEFGRGLVLEPYVSTAVLCAHILDHCSNAGTRSSTLAAIAEGRSRLALAHYEPAGRYAPQQVAAVASRTGDGFRLNGRKSCVLDAASADQFIVSARVAGEDGYSLFLVDESCEGLRLNAYPLIDGTRAADIVLENVPAVASALLAGAGTAAGLLQEALDRAILARIAMALGAMETVLELTAEYIKTRTQFGQPIGKFQALQHRMAEMFVEVQETRSILYCGLAHLDAEPALRSPIISAAKLVTTNAGKIVGGQGMQLHGGIGMTNEYAVGHYYKYLLAFEKIYGDADWHLERFAEYAAV